MSWDHVKGYEKELKAGDVIAIIWSIEDVIYCGEELGVMITDEEARDLLSIIQHRHDAEIGVSWVVIETHIEMSDIDYPPVVNCPECDNTPYSCNCGDKS